LAAQSPPITHGYHAKLAAWRFHELGILWEQQGTASVRAAGLGWYSDLVQVRNNRGRHVVSGQRSGVLLAPDKNAERAGGLAKVRSKP
jgi:hypothetical protein